MSRPTRAWLPHVVLGLALLAIWAWLLHWANLDHSWSNDEEHYRHFAAAVARDFPWSIFQLDPAYGRGIQRLHLLLMGLPLTSFENPTAFELAHGLFIAVYVSAAIPVWLIARGCGLGGYQALGPAVLAVLTPWAVMSTSFLTEPVGYGVFAWALWAMWRAISRPSLAADVVAIGLLVLAVVARTGFLLLIPLLPTVAVLQTWRFSTGSGPRPTRVRRLPAAALLRQPIAVGAGVIGLIALGGAWAGLAGLDGLTGTYATSFPPLDEMLLKARTFLSRVDGGLGFLLFAVALAWLTSHALRARDESRHALAWLGLLASAAVLLSLVGGDQDERYVMFLAVPFALAAALAAFRWDMGIVPTVGAAVAAIALFVSPGWSVYQQNDFSYRAIPVEAFMNRVVMERLDGRVWVGALFVAAGLALVVAVGLRPAWRRWLPLVLVPAVVLQLGATQYSVTRHARSVGAASGASNEQRAWVDRRLPDGETAGLYAVSAGLSGDYFPIWREVQFWNTTMRSVVKVNSAFSSPASSAVPYPIGTRDVQTTLDPATGRISNSGSASVPRYLVVPQPPHSVALAWDVVASADYLPAALVRVRRPLRARTTVANLGLDGRVSADTPVELSVYTAAVDGALCAYADLIAPAEGPAAGIAFQISGAGQARGRLAPQERRRVHLPLGSGSAGVERFRLEAAAGTQLGNWDTLAEPCPKSEP